jgi:hypothetical protein
MELHHNMLMGVEISVVNSRGWNLQECKAMVTAVRLGSWIDMEV